MKRTSILGACLSAALLAACGGSNSFSSSTPESVTPQAVPSLVAPRAGLAQPFGLQTTLGVNASHRVRKNIQTEQVLHSFGNGNGAYPRANLINVDGILYGTTELGGANGKGAVFAVLTNGTEFVLYSFKGGSDGNYPDARLTNVGHTLYGTTSSGGTSNEGTVFAVTTSGAENVLHSFKGGSDGARPQAGLTDVDGTLYGTTERGGANNSRGTVYKITTSGTETVLHSFSEIRNDGLHPNAGLTNLDGTLYGTTTYGGSNPCEGVGCGTVYKITTSGTETVLYSFGGGSDGSYPWAGLTNLGGTLVFYGTTRGGGTSGKGTVFGITTSGFEKVLYSFAGGSDGASPKADLTIVDSLMYGTTTEGGANGAGTIFAVLKDGTEFVLYSFAGKPDGSAPEAGLTNLDGTLYGTTLFGGEKDFGTVFSFAP